MNWNFLKHLYTPPTETKAEEQPSTKTQAEIIEKQTPPSRTEQETTHPEYLSKLLIKCTPNPLLDKITQLINSSIPEFLRQCIDEETEKKLIYNHLKEPFTDYIHLIAEQVKTDIQSEARDEINKLSARADSLSARLHDAEQSKEDIQRQQLSSERQRRTLADKVQEMENRINKLEKEKDSIQRAKEELHKRLSRTETVTKNDSEQSVALQKELTDYKQQLQEARSKIQILEKTIQNSSDSSIENTANIQQDLISEKQKNTSLNGEVQRLLSVQQGLHAQLRKAMSEKEELVSRIEELSGTLETLRGKHDNKKIEVDTEKMQQLQQELNNIRNLYDTAKSQHKDLLTQIARNAEDRTTLQNEISKLKKKLKKQTTEFNEEIMLLKKQQHEIESKKNATISIKPIELDNDNWLVPPKPDTPEEIEQRKAAERARKKEEEEEVARQKAEQNKPDPAQMSLW